MSIKLHCDFCKREIGNDECLFVFRMWALGGFNHYPAIPVDTHPIDDEYQICSDCIERFDKQTAKVVE